MSSTCSNVPMTSRGGLAYLLIRSIQSWPAGLDSPCFVAPERALTARQILSLVSARVELFKEYGVSAGDLVVAATGRGQSFWLDVLAIWALGGCAIPTEPNISQSRLTILLEKAPPQWRIGAISGLSGNTIKALPDCGQNLAATREIPLILDD